MKQILLVDDEPGFLASLVEGLSEVPGYSLRTAPDGKAAAEILDSTPVDLVLTDLKMPGMGGFELVAYMARNHTRVPILVMTAFATPETEENLRVMGVSGLVEKPIDFEALQSRIARALSGGESAAPGHDRSVEELLGTLREAAANASDGEVVARRGRGFARFFFHGGRVAWVVSSEVRQTLMALLVDRGQVALDDVKVVFEECRKSGKNFGETLIEWGLIEREALREVMLDQFSQGLASVMGWSGTKVLFVPEVRSYSGTLLFDLDELLGRVAASAGALPVPEPAAAESAAPEPLPERPRSAEPPGDAPSAPAPAADHRSEPTGDDAMSELKTIIESLRNVEGFIGAAAFTPAGEILAEASSTGTSLVELGALANDILLKSQKSTDIMGVGRGNMVHISAPRAQVLVRCHNENTDFAANEVGRAHVHVMLILDAEGNLGLGKMRLEKAMQQLAPHLR